MIGAVSEVGHRADTRQARTRRGRLCSIDLLPVAADAAIDDAAKEVRARKKTQTEIRAALNATLAVIGQGPISRTAFNQWAQRVIAGGYQSRAAPSFTCPHCGADLTAIFARQP